MTASLRGGKSRAPPVYETGKAQVERLLDFMDFWSSGLLVFWSSGLLVFWSSGLLVFWSSGLLGRWACRLPHLSSPIHRHRFPATLRIAAGCKEAAGALSHLPSQREPADSSSKND